MRRQYFRWTYLVVALVLTIYGGYSVIYYLSKQKNVPILGLVFLIVGGTLLVIYFILLIISLIQNKKNPPQEEIVETNAPEEAEEEKVEDPVVEETPASEEVEKPVIKETYTPRSDSEYRPPRRTSRSYSGDTVYIRKVGYGPVLRVTDSEILDMRSNTYYRIEGNMVNRSGSGPVFEISGNRIREAFGGYLYEISGNSVNKIYGGFYASIDGGYLQTHDLSEKYEISGQLNLAQKLAVVALLFGGY